MIALRRLPSLLLVVLIVACGAGIGCSRTRAHSTRDTSRDRATTPGRPSADQVFHDALYVRTADGDWVEPGVNDRPGTVHIGTTTRADLLRLFGYPTHRRTAAHGGEVWYYAAIRRAQDTARSQGTARTARLRIQRKLAITFAAGSNVVTDLRTYVSGERVANPFRDAGPPFPPLVP